MSSNFSNFTLFSFFLFFWFLNDIELIDEKDRKTITLSLHPEKLSRIYYDGFKITFPFKDKNPEILKFADKQFTQLIVRKLRAKFEQQEILIELLDLTPFLNWAGRNSKILRASHIWLDTNARSRVSTLKMTLLLVILVILFF